MVIQTLMHLLPHLEIKNNKCEGFVRMKDIPNDFFDFNKQPHIETFLSFHK